MRCGMRAHFHQWRDRYKKEKLEISKCSYIFDVNKLCRRVRLVYAHLLLSEFDDTSFSASPVRLLLCKATL